MAAEFLDLMPHRIRVTIKEGTPDDYGYVDPDSNVVKVYACLVDDSQTNSRTSEGRELQSGLVAYVHSVPLGDDEPVNIENDMKVELLTPAIYKGNRPVKSISRHFDETGALHNMEIAFQ